MDFLILISVFLIGIMGIAFYKKYRPSDNSNKNYYYKRFMRNKLQAENHIQQLVQIIAVYECGNQYFDEENKLTIQAYLIHLQNEFRKDYPEVIMKKMKKNKLRHADKKVYAKMVLMQSEKLYHVEIDLGSLMIKYPLINYTLA